MSVKARDRLARGELPAKFSEPQKPLARSATPPNLRSRPLSGGMGRREIPGDIGVLRASADLSTRFLGFQLNGRVFIYQVWPSMHAGRTPPRHEQPDWAKAMPHLCAAEFPKRDALDDAARWVQPCDPSAPHWKGNLHRTRDVRLRVFRGLEERFPALARSY